MVSNSVGPRAASWVETMVALLGFQTAAWKEVPWAACSAASRAVPSDTPRAGMSGDERAARWAVGWVAQRAAPLDDLMAAPRVDTTVVASAGWLAVSLAGN